MKSFYYVRHGQSVSNSKNLICGGGVDAPLTDLGKEQATQAREKIIPHKNYISRIFVSPLGRAFETASIINEGLNKEMVVVPEIAEWSLGNMENKDREDFGGSLLNYTGDPDGGESHAEFSARLGKALQLIQREKEHILVVAHGLVWYNLLRLIKLEPKPISNAVPYEVLYSDSWSFSEI